MLSTEITDIRRFTSYLFTASLFDDYFLHDAEFCTAFSVTFDGRKNPSFYEEAEREEEMKAPFMTYKSLRPMFFSLIKGKRLPVSFRIVLLSSPEMTERIVRESGFTGKVSSLSMNVLYREGKLTVSTGIAYQTFTTDRSLEDAWDRAAASLLSDCL